VWCLRGISGDTPCTPLRGIIGDTGDTNTTSTTSATKGNVEVGSKSSWLRTQNVKRNMAMGETSMHRTGSYWYHFEGNGIPHRTGPLAPPYDTIRQLKSTQNDVC
jgi:hypothetical protein